MRSKVRLSSLRGPRSDLNGTGSRLLCAMSAAEDLSSPLHSVTDHAAAAKPLGLTISPSLLTRADDVIQ